MVYIGSTIHIEGDPSLNDITEEEIMSIDHQQDQWPRSLQTMIFESFGLLRRHGVLTSQDHYMWRSSIEEYGSTIHIDRVPPCLRPWLWVFVI